MIDKLLQVMLSLKAIQAFCKEDETDCKDCVFYINKSIGGKYCMFIDFDYEGRCPEEWDLMQVIQELKILLTNEEE